MGMALEVCTLDGLKYTVTKELSLLAHGQPCGAGSWPAAIMVVNVEAPLGVVGFVARNVQKEKRAAGAPHIVVTP